MKIINKFGNFELEEQITQRGETSDRKWDSRKIFIKKHLTKLVCFSIFIHHPFVLPEGISLAPRFPMGSGGFF